MTSTTIASPQLSPITPSERIVALDVLRGVALLGIFFVNMQLFSMPLGPAMVHDPALAGGPLDDRIAWGFVKACCEYKFISLFSLLFGMGFAIQLQRARDRGRALTGTFLRRLLVLAIIGLVHAILLWYGDILFIYAVIGTTLLLVQRWSPFALLLAAGASLALHVNMETIGQALQSMPGMAPSFDVEVADPPLRGLQAIGAAQGPADPRWIAAETLAHTEGPFGEAVVFRTVTFLFALVGCLFDYGWRILGLFLTGAALIKLDFFAPQWARVHRLLALVCLPVGLALELAALWPHLADVSFLSGVAGRAAHTVGSLILMAGYVGAGTLFASRWGDSLLARALARTGRMALTVYLLETVISVTLMEWWGGGLFGRVGRLEQLGLVVAIYAALVVFASLWLSRFSMGPMERLWRTLTYRSR